MTKKADSNNTTTTISIHNGVVKFFNDSKGYGFLTEEETGVDHFVHFSGLSDQVGRGDRVTFEIGEGKKGPMAVNVRYVGKS